MYISLILLICETDEDLEILQSRFGYNPKSEGKDGLLWTLHEAALEPEVECSSAICLMICEYFAWKSKANLPKF